MFGKRKRNKNQPAFRTVSIHLKAITDAMDFLERKQKVICIENVMGQISYICEEYDEREMLA